jgi:hypothetical protein
MRAPSGFRRTAILLGFSAASSIGACGTSTPTGPTNFTATGAPIVARRMHTATLLPSGRVLIAGGLSGGVTTSAAELYDPGTGTFTATGRMTVARYEHTATLLPGGRVLIAGGSSGEVASTATAELYDSATGAFTATGSMTAVRSTHTATLLPSGRVLIAGGPALGPEEPYMSTAEVYDPGTGRFTATGSMTAGRSMHAALALPSGLVLITGGSPGDRFKEVSLSTAELYDPATGRFTATGGMTVARYRHTATLLLSGRVLVVGEASADLYDP